jgi:O-antigen ligase
LPLVSIFVRADISAGHKALVALVWLLAAIKPAHATLLVAAALPLGLLWTSTFAGLTPAAIPDILMLAFASGAALHFTWPRAGTRDLLSRPALILATIVVTRTIWDLAALRAVAPGRPFIGDLWHHVYTLYWTDDAGNWLVVHDALRWLANLSAAVFVERALRQHAGNRPLATWLWIGAAAAATSFTLIRVIEIVVRRETSPLESLWWIVTNVRLSVLHPDPNAAGSILAWLIVAAAVIGARRRLWWMLGLACPMLGAAFAFAQSRSAVGALAIVLVARFVTPRVFRHRALSWPLVIGLCLVTALGFWMVRSRSHVDPAQALSLRYEMTKVGARMAAAFPIFGVGLGDYARTSRRFVRPEQETLIVFARQGENAHNNYLQVMVELGIPAGMAFLWLVVPAALAAWRGGWDQLTAEHQGLALGLSVFLVSALFGHPLLIPEVAAMFFLGLGLTAAHHKTMTRRAADYGQYVLWGTVTFFVVALAARLI